MHRADEIRLGARPPPNMAPATCSSRSGWSLRRSVKCQRASRLPGMAKPPKEVEASTSGRTRLGYENAICWATAPPNEAPSTWADGMPSSSSTRTSDHGYRDLGPLLPDRTVGKVQQTVGKRPVKTTLSHTAAATREKEEASAPDVWRRNPCTPSPSHSVEPSAPPPEPLPSYARTLAVPMPSLQTPARTSTPPRWKTRWPPIPRSKRPPSSAFPIRAGERRSTRSCSPCGTSQLTSWSHCRERIAGFKVPRCIELRAEPLPKSAAGKYLKRDLREPHWAGRHTQVSGG